MGQLGAGDDDSAEPEQGDPHEVGQRRAPLGAERAAEQERQGHERPGAQQRGDQRRRDAVAARAPSRAPAPSAPMTTNWRATTARTATALASSSPVRPRGVTPSRRSTPYRRSNPVEIAWPVKADEMTQRASTPGHGEVDAAAGAQRDRAGVARGRRGRPPGSTMATSSCSPLRSNVPASNRAWASDPLPRARRGRDRSAPGMPRSAGVALMPRTCGSGRSSGPRAATPAGDLGQRALRDDPCPAATTTMWSARRSASSNEWVVRTTAAPASAVAAHEVPDVQPGVRVQPGARLVEEDDLGPADQGGGEGDPLALATRTAGARTCAANSAMPEPLGEVVDGCRRGIQRGEVVQERAAGGPRWAARRPGASRRRGPGGRGRRATGRVPEHPDLAGVGTAQPLAALDHRRLAGAVGAQHRR